MGSKQPIPARGETFSDRLRRRLASFFNFVARTIGTLQQMEQNLRFVNIGYN